MLAQRISFSIYSALILLCALQPTAIQGETEGLYAHGIAATGSQAKGYAAQEILRKNYTTFTFPDSKGLVAKHLRVNPFVTDFGQNTELQAFERGLNKARAKTDGSKISVVALSRGAVVAFNYLALNNPSCIESVILESPCDSFKNLIKDKFSYPLIRNVIHRIVFANHDLKGIHPSRIAHDYPKNVPTLLISSQEDYALPATLRLNKKMQSLGCDKVHLLILPRGKHGHLVTGPDKDMYQQVAHAFYKHYNLAHNPVLAQLGEPLFKNLVNQAHKND